MNLNNHRKRSHSHTIALDQIISQIMEQGNSSRPVPATDDVMQQLHREVLEEKCESMSKSPLFAKILIVRTSSSATGARLRRV
jgi:hypothetical protein